ncbi:phospholipid transport system substrate-binding protein [Orbus hercynius]|uniref:Phospholipid transport system substrate-binding protein n=1 Tax=Orbus hercynius TaxID=593135 RepID=A0A495RBI6_9GAMM|nr:phospholipid-binding protein MlaC [Orbus hercynius]RKS84701.1 phospholipid transport system substrate-binding protein [Orbus hercynius]
MLKKIMMVTLLFFVPVVIAAPNNNENPYKQMEVAADQIFSSINNQAEKIKRNPEILREIVKQDLLPHIQTKYAGALVLGSYYKSATPAQRDAYFAAFENYLIQAFSQALSMYKGQQYQIEQAKDLTGKNMVSIRVLLINADANQAPIRLDFQWRKNTVSGEWKAYDLIAEGVSMITTKQTEWATILRTDGIDALTKQLNSLAKQKIDLDADIPQSTPAK